jgi:hypothetical protein
MKPAIFPAVVMLLVSTALKAQLSLLPQFGVDFSKTSVRYNDSKCFSPLGTEASPKASLRLDYRVKSGHGAFAGVTTSPGAVAFSVTDPSSPMTSFKASTGSLQWRLEAGYQFTSKPIQLGHSKGSASTPAATSEAAPQKRCGSYSHCSSQKAQAKKPQNLTLRLQPSVGFAYIPNASDDVEDVQGVQQYNAGNWKTAVVSGMAFELGKGKARLMTLGIYYTVPFDNHETTTITTEQNGKFTTTNYSSSSTVWSIGLGVPFTLGSTGKPAKHTTQKRSSHCSYYRSPCSGRVQ